MTRIFVNNKLKDKRNYIFHGKRESWGSSVYIMHEIGYSFVRIYCYNDNNDVLYLESLSVDENKRNGGYGNGLLYICEQYARIAKIKTIQLWCDKNSWVYEWYKRNGYVEIKPHETEQNHIWMEKQII